MEKWELARIDRLEDRIDQFDRKNWERSSRNFLLIIYGVSAAMILLAIATIVLSASHLGN